ncbi:Uncharacterised protein [Candidatus Gugararchaeum adminiculabundum]|nr:Uncharacterised protein [Candidatus Gugararchaeum adminiculabundum]
MIDNADLYEGVKFMEEKQYAKAIVSLDDIAHKKGECFEIYELQGMCYYHMEDWRNAVRTLATAISYLESPQPNLYQFKGLANLYLGEFSFSVHDLFLALRYTPVETLSGEADLLSNIFFACVLAGDERAHKIFDLGYSHCPERMMDNIQQLFDSFFVKMNVPQDEKIAMQEQINQLKEQAEADQKVIEKMTAARGEKLTALIDNLKNLKIAKKPENPLNYEARDKIKELVGAEEEKPEEQGEETTAEIPVPREEKKEAPKPKERKTGKEAADDFIKKIKNRGKK